MQLSRPSARPRLFHRDSRGSVAVQAAMLLLLVLGFIALGVEISQLLLEQRKQQSVADATAMTAASALALGVTDLQAEGRAMAAQLGYRDGVGGVSVTVTRPPSSGAHANDNKYVEVKVSRSFTPALVQIFRAGSLTVTARAVALAGQSSTACILALGASGTAIDMSNNSKLTLPGCGVATNSTSNSSIALANNATIEGNVATAGDVSKANNAVITGTVTNHASVVADPYAGVSLTANGPDRDTSGDTLRPGVYASGWDLKNNTTKTLEAGVYYIKSELKLGNNVTLTGSGVTIVMAGDYAMDIGNNVVLNLSAPLTGPSKGVVFYNSAKSSSVTQRFSNNTTLNVTGALYFPGQTVKLDNNVATTGSSCTQIVAKAVQLDNNASVTLKPDCSGAGTTQIGSSAASSLAE